MIKSSNSFQLDSQLRIEEMEISAVDPKTWRFRVGPLHAPQTRELQLNAVYLSGVPAGEDGSGMFAVPKVGDSCTVLISGVEGRGLTAYILGFRVHPNQVTGGAGGASVKTGLEEGDYMWVSRIGMLMKASIRGGFHWVVDNWGKFMIGRTNQEVRGWFRNMYWRMRGGRVEWETAKGDESSKFLSVVSDKFEADQNNDARLDEPFVPTSTVLGLEPPVYANKVINKIGNWGENRGLVQEEIRAGVVDTGELPSRIHKTEKVIPDGAEVVKGIYGPNGSMVIRVLEDTSKLRVDFYNGTSEAELGDSYCSFDVTPDTLAVNHTGNVVVTAGGDATLNAPGAITIGGEGEEQQLVTKQFVEQIYKMHTHMGNFGAPTSTPINNPEILDPLVRDSMGHFTKDTVAE